jgi:hypothetical protein
MLIQLYCFIIAMFSLLNSYYECVLQHSLIIKQDAFNYAMTEWRQQELRYLQATTCNLHNCPSCQESPHTIHLDGNAKLFRYNKG